MNKKAKMYVGLGVVAVVAYYFYHQAQMKKAAVATTAAKFVGADANRDYYTRKREQGASQIRRRK